jgi:hypothetical protein
MWKGEIGFSEHGGLAGSFDDNAAKERAGRVDRAMDREARQRQCSLPSRHSRNSSQVIVSSRKVWQKAKGQ